MGLDQYIYKVTELDFTSKEEIAYFRKANSLQGYFEEKYHIDNLEYHRISKEDVVVSFMVVQIMMNGTLMT